MPPSQWSLSRKIVAAALLIGSLWAIYTGTYAFVDGLPKVWQWVALVAMLAGLYALWLWGKAIDRRQARHNRETERLD